MWVPRFEDASEFVPRRGACISSASCNQQTQKTRRWLRSEHKHGDMVTTDVRIEHLTQTVVEMVFRQLVTSDDADDHKLVVYHTQVSQA